MAAEPRLLLMLADPSQRQRWQEVLATRFVVDCPDIASALGLETPPDVCVIDLGARTVEGLSWAAMIRGVYPQVELIGVAAHPEVALLSSGINDAGMRRFVPLDASPAEILAQVELDPHSPYVLRQRFDALTAAHGTLIKEHGKLIDELTARESQLAETTANQEMLRARLDSLVEPVSKTNALSWPDLRQRLADELAAYERGGLGCCVLAVFLKYTNAVEPAGVRERIISAIADATRHIDQVGMNGKDRVLILMPATRRNRAAVVRDNVLATIAGWRLPVAVAETQLFSYPDDAAQIARLTA